MGNLLYLRERKKINMRAFKKKKKHFVECNKKKITLPLFSVGVVFNRVEQRIFHD